VTTKTNIHWNIVVTLNCDESPDRMLSLPPHGILRERTPAHGPFIEPPGAGSRWMAICRCGFRVAPRGSGDRDSFDTIHRAQESLYGSRRDRFPSRKETDEDRRLTLRIESDWGAVNPTRKCSPRSAGSAITPLWRTGGSACRKSRASASKQSRS